jgi:hypothetical protein
VRASIAVLILPASSLAAGHSQNGSTVGNCISDGLSGNEPTWRLQSCRGPLRRAFCRLAARTSPPRNSR